MSPDHLPRSATPSAAPASEPQRILVVCAANVCRSPATEFFLRRELEARAPGTRWSVESSGATARDGEAMCPRTAAFVRRSPGGSAFAAQHRARALTVSAIERAGLILVASTSERATVASLSPASRRRTFTVKEAAMMLQRLDRSPSGQLPLVAEEGHLLGTLVDLLHERRGTLAISAGPAHFSSWRAGRQVPRIDLGDVHQGQERRHKPVHAAIAEASRLIGEGVAQVAVRPAPVPAPVSPDVVPVDGGGQDH